MNIDDLAVRISEAGSYEGYRFECQPVPAEDAPEVLEVVVEGFDELPVYLSISENQILCITYLWLESEVVQEKRVELLETLLEMNIPMPLSSFSKVGERYVIFGSLSVQAGFEEILQEISTLVENAVEAISAMEDYLK